MKNQFAGMDEAEFTSLVHSYIERMATGYGEMPAEFFLDLLVERMAVKANETVNLSIDVSAGDDLVITPDRELSDIVIRGNEILVGKRRFVLKLAEHT
ncbi:MAG TPA: hypothetical protein PLD25_32320 [Chloroflexota bacterium]|nr:hypothetical protein [Chloroflexota bacterium]HUM69930.1 hypothetical protein [Chloroflexota bacterium]